MRLFFNVTTHSKLLIFVLTFDLSPDTTQTMFTFDFLLPVNSRTCKRCSNTCVTSLRLDVSLRLPPPPSTFVDFDTYVVAKDREEEIESCGM
jgi:hypothetical protein